jgi:hypothetical protein
MREGRKDGSWFNPDIITERSFVFGKREEESGRKAEKIYSLPN